MRCKRVTGLLSPRDGKKSVFSTCVRHTHLTTRAATHTAFTKTAPYNTADVQQHAPQHTNTLHQSRRSLAK
jgi:hypothetical protein